MNKKVFNVVYILAAIIGISIGKTLAYKWFAKKSIKNNKSFTGPDGRYYHSIDGCNYEIYENYDEYIKATIEDLHMFDCEKDFKKILFEINPNIAVSNLDQE